LRCNLFTSEQALPPIKPIHLCRSKLRLRLNPSPLEQALLAKGIPDLIRDPVSMVDKLVCPFRLKSPCRSTLPLKVSYAPAGIRL